MPDDGASAWGRPTLGISARQPPANLRAEQALLGGLICNNRAFDQVAGFLRPEHFADPVNGRVFAEIARLVGGGRLADGVTLVSLFQNTDILDPAGGAAYIGHLMSAMIGIISVREYGRCVLDAWQRRELIDAGERLVNAAFGAEPDATAAQIAAEAVATIDRMTAGSGTLNRLTTSDAAMDAALVAIERATLGETTGISSGFRCIDARLGGLEPGLVYVVAGRPGMGKSSLGHQIAVNAARAGTGVLELSLEMSAQQLGRRMLATAARVPIMAMKAGRLNLIDADRVVRARKELAGLPLSIDDTAGQTPAQIAAKARAARRKHGLGLVMVDHLNLMRAEDHDARHGGTYAVERASGMMLQMAKDCECPVLLLAQLNRGVEGREDKRPTLSDLRQAGAIEQDAYAVGFVYRPEYYMGSEPDRKENETPLRHAERREEWADRKAAVSGRAEIIWGKVRDGEAGTDVLTFHGPTATFGEHNDA